MKNKEFSFYPILNKYFENECKFNVSYYFFYYPKNEKTPVEIKRKVDTKNISLLSDSFSTVHDDLLVRIVISFKNGNILYGGNGIAPTGSSLSICVESLSQKAKYRQVVKSKKEISPTDGEQTHTFEIFLPKATFYNEVVFNTYCFLSKSTNKLKPEEAYLNNQEGVILGLIDDKKLSFEGNGALFPIFISEMNSETLWDLEINIDDVYEDNISDNVKLILNKNHKDFRCLDANDTKHYCDSLIVNIMINAVTVLLAQIIHSFPDNKIPTDQNYEFDTFAGFAQYFSKQAGKNANFTDFLSISKTVREFVYRMEGD